MNTLIIGGLLVIGIAALIALFFVARSSDSGTSKNAAPKANKQQPPAAAKQEEAEKPTPARSPVPAADQTSVAVRDEEPQWGEPFDGQFHELSMEVRTLHQQARDMEMRLERLTAILEHIEQVDHSANGHTSISEEAPYNPGTPPTR